MAEDITTLQYANTQEANAYALGLEICSVWTAQWHGMDLLDDETNKLVKSLLSHGAIEKRMQNEGGNGYVRWDLLLQERSVVDFSMLVMDDIYYEQSNFLGGETVAFSREEFTAFITRIAALSQDALPQNADILFDLAVRAFAKSEDEQRYTLAAIAETLQSFQANAVTVERRPRPIVMLPGIYGAYAMVSQASRSELLALAEDISALLFGEGSTPIRMPDDQTPGTRTSIQSITNALYALSDTLAGILPGEMPPMEYREVYDYARNLVSRQIDIDLGTARLYLEWSPSQENNQAVYIAIASGDAKLSLLLSNENGDIMEERKAKRVTNRSIAELNLQQDALEIHLVRTSIQDIENNGAKEIAKTQTKWMLDSPTLLGADTVVTLASEQTDTASGQGTGYKRIKETEWFLSGLDDTDMCFLSSTQTITAKDAKTPAVVVEDATHPALFSQADFEAWLESLRTHALQVYYTVLGRIPSENAPYLLEIIQSQAY